jgi:hypothetical protein
MNWRTIFSQASEEDVMSKPPILNYAVPQRKDEGVIYSYDENLNLNVVMTKNGKTKFINLADSYIELATKTDVERERDDVGERIDSALAFATVTKVERESTDDTLDFATKTNVQREADDEVWGHHLSEFNSKTFVERERDEEYPNSLLDFVTKTRIERESDDQ